MNKLEGPSFLPNKKPKKLIFLLHGYGDNAVDCVEVTKNLITLLKELKAN